jgi:CheY-like chemotaxis protein
MPVPGTINQSNYSYASAVDEWSGLLRLAMHVGSTDVACLFLEHQGNFQPLASSGTSDEAMATAAQILPLALRRWDTEKFALDASLESEATARLATTLSGAKGFVSMHRIAVGSHGCQMVLVLAHQVPRLCVTRSTLEMIREVGRQAGLRMEAQLERRESKALRESVSSLYLHLEKMGGARCTGHCIVNGKGRLLSVSESLLNNLRLNRERVYARSFGDYFSFQPGYYDFSEGYSDPVISWHQLQYTPCTFQPDDGPSVRLVVCSLRIPYPGESEAWHICLLHEGEDAGGVFYAGNTPTVLIAEDHPVNQRVIQGMVEKLGLRADVVSNGLEAVHAVCSKSYAAILMDCQMPEMDGVEATQFIRSNQESLGRIPIVAVTAVGQEEDRERCLEAGVEEILVKPIRMEELAEVLERWTGFTGRSLEDSVDEVSPNSHRMDEALDRLRADLDTEVVRDIVMLFIDDSKARLDHLSTVADAHNWVECRALVHTLKGSSSSLGAADLVEACEAFEAEKSQDSEVLRQRIAVIEQRFKEAVPMLKNYLHRLPPG